MRNPGAPACRAPSHARAPLRWLAAWVALTSCALGAVETLAGMPHQRPATDAPAPAPGSAPASVPEPAPAPTPAPAASNPAPVAPPSPGTVASAVAEPAGATGPVASARAGQAAAAAPAGPPSFATVTRDATRVEGVLSAWRKDDKVWLELQPGDFGRPWLFSPKVARGIGEGRIFGGQMIGRTGPTGRAQVVALRRVHQQVQLVALNPQYLAQSGTPQARAVAAAFTESLLSSTTVASQPHPQTGAVLVDAGPLFLGDLLALSSSLQRRYRQSYALDARHTGFAAVRGTSLELVLNVQAHYAASSLSLPGSGSATSGAPVSTLPSTLPDARSLFVGLHYSLAALPETPMRPRAADPRLGHFTTSVFDYTRETAVTPRRSFVERWRLEKKDSAADMSEPVRPLVFWLDRSVPLAFREAITQGVLEWNKAFERIGYRDALVVKVQPDDADFDTLDVGAASIRWVTSAQSGFDGYGPSVSDPRSGEILDADIVIDAAAARTMRNLRAQILGGQADGGGEPEPDFERLMQFGNPARLRALQAAGALGHMHAPGESCDYASRLAESHAFAHDLLASRGEIPLAPDSPEAEAFAQERVKAVTVHEVGHALGLRHNFRSSRAYTLAQLADPAFTAVHGITASVMDYPDLNLPPPGVRLRDHGAVFRSALGPYDYWAIEYAYRPLDGLDEAQERVALQRIAARSAEPQLAYGTDEDNASGIDPESLTFDLGDDPVAFGRLRLAMARELLDRQETRVPGADEGWWVLRRTVRYAVRDAAAAAGVMARQIGGVRLLRDQPGSGRDPLQPVDAAVQRAALDALLEGVLAPGAFAVSPALQRRLAADFSDGPGSDFSWAQTVTRVQRTLLGRLMSEEVALRLLDSADKQPPGSSFGVGDLLRRLREGLWRAAPAEPGAAALQRDLQREHVDLLAAAVLRPTTARADLRTLHRAEARALRHQLAQALERAGPVGSDGADLARAHLHDALDSLDEVLAARVQRPAP